MLYKSLRVLQMSWRPSQEDKRSEDKIWNKRVNGSGWEIYVIGYEMVFVFVCIFVFLFIFVI